MRTFKNNWGTFLGTVVIGGAIMGLVITVVAQSVPLPLLTIATTGTNQVLVTITNGVSFSNYELYRTPILNSVLYPWQLVYVGTNGQTNFTLDMGLDTTGFIKAGIGSDWDSDGVPNWMDANPTDPNVGALTITIDSPVNGTVFN